MAERLSLDSIFGPTARSVALSKMTAMKFTAIAIAACASLTLPAKAAPWVRGYVVSNYEPAFWYGGKIGSTERGGDCPKGANPDNDYRKILKTDWRSDAEVRELTRPVSETGKDPVAVMNDALSHRGFRPDIETYINPFAVPDQGMQQVTGKIAEGFDLDNNPSTGGFVSPSGQRGIDNAFYRVMGCGLSYRGVPYTGYLSTRGNDKMQEGLYTMVVRISGNGDPMNDDAATIEIGYSPDHLIKDAAGRVVSDYSFRLAKSAQYTRAKARIRAGVVESDQIPELRIPGFAWYETNRGEAVFYRARVRLQMTKDGGLSGLLGGYQDYRQVYAKDTFNVPSDGQSRETTYYQNQVGFYYALKRNADGLPDKDGHNIGISTAYRFLARPAFVVDPRQPVVIDQPPGSDRANIRRALFLRAVTTKAISPEPPRPRRRPISVPASAPDRISKSP